MPGIEKDAPRPGRKPAVSPETVQEIILKTTCEKPPNATHRSRRTMAAAAGVSASTVGRLWRAHGLKPHRVKTFKLSNDPRFAEKLDDIVGLCLNPPAHALVLSLDEKSQIQALDRTQPGLPLKKGRGQPMTHDYKRNGSRFGTEEKCINHFERIRWPEGVVCPKCNGTKTFRYESPGKTDKVRYLRGCSTCKHRFSVTVGSIFHDSHLPHQVVPGHLHDLLGQARRLR